MKGPAASALKPEDLTDEMIREFRDRMGNPEWSTICARALVPDGQRVVAVWYDARCIIADALNAERR